MSSVGSTPIRSRHAMEGIVKLVGFILGLISLIGWAVALIPLLGWLNWIFIPLAVLGLAFSLVGVLIPVPPGASVLPGLSCA